MSSRRQCSTALMMRVIMRRGAARIPPYLYPGIGLTAGPEAASALPLIPQMELLWRSLIWSTTAMKFSRPFMPGNMYQGEDRRPGLRTRIKSGSEMSVYCCCHHSCWPQQSYFVTPKRWVRRRRASGTMGTAAGAYGEWNSDGNCGAAVVKSLLLSTLFPIKIAQGKTGKVGIMTRNGGERGVIYLAQSRSNGGGSRKWRHNSGGGDPKLPGRISLLGGSKNTT